MTTQNYLSLLLLSLATHTHLHAAQMNVEVKEQETKQLSAEEQAAAEQMFRIIRWTSSQTLNKQQSQAFQKLLQTYPIIVHAKSNYGLTALMLAYEQPEIAKLLIAVGADLNAKNDYGNTALMLAYRKPEFVKLLIDAGADLNTKNNCSYTALMLAAWQGETNVIELLIAAGADETLQNNDGKTALDVAIMQGRQDEYSAGFARGKRELQYAKAQKEASAMLSEYMIPQLAKITAEYAYNPRVPKDLPEKQPSWWDKAKSLASKLYRGKS